MSDVQIDVAIVSWNTRDFLDRCLESLRPDTDHGLASVWVIDNASSDGSPDMVRERHPWVHLIASEENLGYGPAINVVAEQTSAPWLIVSNSDIKVTDGALERLLAAGKADPGVGVVAPRLILPDGSTQHSIWPFPSLAPMIAANLPPRAVPRAYGERHALSGRWDPERPRRVPWALGAFLLVRRSAFDAIGGFDPYQWMSAEDLDLGWRMHEAGWATRYEPSALVHHEESAAAKQMWGSSLAAHWQRCAYAWMVRRRGRLRAAGVGAANLAGSSTRFVLYAARGRRWRKRARAQASLMRVHTTAFAPRKTLERYR